MFITYINELSKFELLFHSCSRQLLLFRNALKTSEDAFHELKESTQDLQEKLSTSIKERDKLQVILAETEEKNKKLETLTERARELFGPPNNSEKTSTQDICGICFEEFDDSDRRRKLFNPCGHTACNTCVTKKPVSNCYMCRKTVESLVTPLL